MHYISSLIAFLLIVFIISCTASRKDKATLPGNLTAKELLGDSTYLAISYGGYRNLTRNQQPTVEELKEDMKILHAMGIRILRTYNTKLPHASNVLKAIRELKEENPDFEMYVMLGAWINCANAWTDHPNHDAEDAVGNQEEIDRAVQLANEYEDIVKIIAVGNEAMVKWAASYYVKPGVILKWVNYLQNLKSKQSLNPSLWITSSDNFASWGGGGSEYHVEDLNKLIKAVDYVSMHTYPMHDTHYNPVFWGVDIDEENRSKEKQIKIAMSRAMDYAKSQYNAVRKYVHNIDANKPIHIGETGWASSSNGFYGPDGSKATDEYKEGLYYEQMRRWTNRRNISCFYFEAFDEQWKDAENPGGSENHFGLINLKGQAKYALWPLVDKGVFAGYTRNGQKITKTYNGDLDSLLNAIKTPPRRRY